MARKNENPVSEEQVKTTTEKHIEEPAEGSPQEEPETAQGRQEQKEGNPEEKAEPEVVSGGYKVICRNPITKQIGGVEFQNGVGYTEDGYAASWFAAKDGYTVEPAE